MSESATDKLRRMLDERGIEWTYADGTVSFANNERWFHAWAYNDGAMCVSMGYLTPEQAIAATLGSEREKALEELVRDMYCELRKDTTFIDKNGNERELPWVAEYLRPIEQRIATLGIKVIDDD